VQLAALEMRQTELIQEQLFDRVPREAGLLSEPPKENPDRENACLLLDSKRFDDLERKEHILQDAGLLVQNLENCGIVPGPPARLGSFW
jgi:hypothetical protein